MEDEMKTEIKVKEHVTPDIDDYHGEKVRLVMSYYGDHFRKCKFCGYPKHTDYVCNCGWDTDYNDSGELVWVKYD